MEPLHRYRPYGIGTGRHDRKKQVQAEAKKKERDKALRSFSPHKG
jgi:hypothetical protein